jgi:hypothetical protein
VEGKIDMAARRQVTNKLRGQYRKATKADRGRILDPGGGHDRDGPVDGTADADRPEAAGAG